MSLVEKEQRPDNLRPLLITSFPGAPLLKRGKEKDLYDLGDMILMISTDRLSVGERSLVQGVAGKGKIINQLSAYWFRKLRSVFPNHMITANKKSFPPLVQDFATALDGRAMLVWKAKPLPVRCIVRGYIAGQSWWEYQEKGTLSGIKLPAGMAEFQRLPAPLFSPSIKGQSQGKTVDMAMLKELLGKSLAEQLRETSLALYFAAWKSARERGVIIAEVEFEFGMHEGKLILIDECLTPESSRLWDLNCYRGNGPVRSFDKHVLLDNLTMEASADVVSVSDDVLNRVLARYTEVQKRFRPH